MVVDEGALSLLGYQTPDPLAVFFASRPAGAPLLDLRNALLGKPEGLKKERRTAAYKRKAALENELRRDTGAMSGLGLAARGKGGGGFGRGPTTPDEAAKDSRVTTVAEAAATPAASPGPMKAGDDLQVHGSAQAGEEGNAPEIRARSLFATTAYYDPSIVTDGQGAAEVTFAMPDNLTTYRVMAVALDRGRIDRFGNGEAQVKVRKPLLLRPSLPRFLTVADSFEAAVMVHNETGRDGTVQVLARGRNVGIGQDLRREVMVPVG